MESLNILDEQQEASSEEKRPEVMALESTVDLETARIRIEKLESVLEAVRARASDSEEEAKNARKKIASLEKFSKGEASSSCYKKKTDQ